MRSGAASWGNPEMGVMAAATVQIGHFYKLPVNVYGLSDSSYAADMQAGYQRALGALVPALAGADELSGVGEMAGGPYSSNFQMVIDDDIYGMVRQVRRGVHVDEESLAVEVIAQAMDAKGSFMGQKHTRKYMRAGEVWRGRFAVQETSWDVWNAAGGQDVLDRAQEESERILADHQVPPLPEEQSKALDEILRLSHPS
jgi:trimethylamine--corrinoid protein Co-methyltransferase